LLPRRLVASVTKAAVKLVISSSKKTIETQIACAMCICQLHFK
jgi:hypothetical protein